MAMSSERVVQLCKLSVDAIQEDIAMIEAGAFHLADALIASAMGTRVSLSPLQRGRLGALRAQGNHRRGARELAAEQYRELERSARRPKSPELRSRALLGLCTIAQLAGNYPEILKLSRQSLRFAKAAGIPRLRRRTPSASYRTQS